MNARHMLGIAVAAIAACGQDTRTHSNGASAPAATLTSLQIPPYVAADHASLINRLVVNNPKLGGLRMATDLDCACAEELANIRLEPSAINKHPYYAVGDFNLDGKDDFAVVLVDQAIDSTKAVTVLRTHADGSRDFTIDPSVNLPTTLVIFDGPLVQGNSPAFLRFAVGELAGSVLFWRKEGLVIGPWGSSGALLQPTDKGYDMVSAP